MSTKIPKDREKTRPETNDNIYDNIEDDVIGTISAPTVGDRIVLDDFVDDNGKGSARMLAFTMLASAVAIVGLTIAGIIKIIH